MRSVKSFQDASANQTLKAVLGLRELVLAGELQTGVRIAELVLVEKLAVSRTPVRAALQRLHEEGLLYVLPTGGFAVRSFTAAEVRDAIEIRGTLEGLAARFAAERGVPATQLNQAANVLAAIDELLLARPLNQRRFAQYISLNAQFHQQLLEMSASEPLARELGHVVNMPFAGPNAFVQIQGQGSDALDVLVTAQFQHHSVLDAITSRESGRAEAIMREHARIAHSNLAKALRQHHSLHRIPGGSLIKAQAG